MGTPDMSSATRAAQKGDRFNIAAMMMGWELLRPALYSNKPLIPIARITASFQ
jgi:hypothetical protein